MNEEQKQGILKSLWPADGQPRLGVWGVLDCARDPKIYGALLESKLEFRCLYSGRLPRALEMNAPHLVEMLPTNRLVHRWLDEGWGQAWGVMLRIEDPSNLRHHLRRFLKVLTEDSRSLLFRFYDPRVLRDYLPTCSAEELRRFFGPVKCFAAEDAGESAWSMYSLGPSGLIVERGTPAGAAPRDRRAAQAELPRFGSGVVVRQVQLGAMRDGALRRWAARCLRESYPEASAAVRIDDIVSAGFELSKRLGRTDPVIVRKLAHVALIAGVDFPRLAWARKIIASRFYRRPLARARALEDAAIAALRAARA